MKVVIFYTKKNMFLVTRETSFVVLVLLLGVESGHGYVYCDNNCKSGDGYFCVADDPAAYSICLAGTRLATMRCQTGLNWDNALKLCNWPSAIKSSCACGQTTTQAPTTPSTTLTPRTGPPPSTRPPSPSGLKRICYYTNWAVYRPGPASYTAGNVDPFMCTHIIVAFMQLAQGKISYLESADGETLTALTKLRNERNPSLKIMVAIGGWNAGSWPFTEVVQTNATMDAFITQAITFLRQNDLDGLDIDWEYPQGMVAQYSLWMQKMRTAFENEALQTGKNRLLLSAAVAAGQATIDWAYDVPKLSNAVDYINLMSYDLNGSWNPTTGLNAGLYPQGGTDPFNVKWCSDYWIQKGADPSKLVVGIPTYGRTFKLCNPGPTQTGIGSKACGTGNAGPYTASAGFEAYYESCLKLQCTVGNWTSFWSDAGQAPYMYSGDQWISYENVTSIAAKVNYVKSKNYAGVMVWTLDLDDFKDICGYGVKSPLMKTLVAVATGQPIPQLNSFPNPAVNPCDPLNSGGGTSGGGSGSSSGTSVDLNLCDKKCAKDGLYCVPDNPQAYYQCLAGVRYPLQYCQSNLKYHYISQACDWPANYPGCNCAVSNNSTTTLPVTSTITTVKTSTTVTSPPITTASTTRTTTQTTGAAISTTLPPSPTSGLKRICYYTNWAVYRTGPASYTAGNVDPFMCTHIIVAFMQLAQGKISYLESADGDTLAALTKLRNERNPSLKIMVAIGGWNAGSWPFTEVVQTNATMDAFITQAITFLRQNDLDGLDIDWEYPQGMVAQYSLWMQKMRAAFENEALQTGKNRLLLSAAVAAGQATIDWAYDVPKLSNAVDYINLMSYDLNGSWNPTTGLNAGLYPQGGTDPFNVKWCSDYWIQKGADPNKLVIGIPTYGRTFKLCNPGPTQTGIGSKACGTGNAGLYTASAGFEAYYESCLKLQCSTGNWTSVWDNAGQAPYMYSGDQWISYENVTSIAAKVNYVKSKNYAGIMVWTLDLDDFKDICGYGIVNPLMKTLVAVATGQPIPKLNAVPNPTVNPCDPLNSGGGTSGGGGSGSTSGTSVDLNLCDNKCAKDGLYCVPDNPQAFYQCLAGVRYPLQYCQSNLRYNYLYQSCDWPQNYPGCNCVISTTTTVKPKMKKRMFKRLRSRFLLQ